MKLFQALFSNIIACHLTTSSWSTQWEIWEIFSKFSNGLFMNTFDYKQLCFHDFRGTGKNIDVCNLEHLSVLSIISVLLTGVLSLQTKSFRERKSQITWFHRSRKNINFTLTRATSKFGLGADYSINCFMFASNDNRLSQPLFSKRNSRNTKVVHHKIITNSPEVLAIEKFEKNFLKFAGIAPDSQCSLEIYSGVFSLRSENRMKLSSVNRD